MTEGVDSGQKCAREVRVCCHGVAGVLTRSRRVDVGGCELPRNATVAEVSGVVLKYGRTVV